MEGTQDGRDAMAVLEAMLKFAEKVPKCLGHPISQLIPYIVIPAVKVYNGTMVFAISGRVTVSGTPDQWERWCMLLKTTALLKYMRMRLNG